MARDQFGNYVPSATPAPGGQAIQDMQVSWEPAAIKLGEEMGYGAWGGLPGITKLVFRGTTSIVGFDIEDTDDLVELDFPNLVSVDPFDLAGGYIECSYNSVLTTFTAPELVMVDDDLYLYSNASLFSLGLPALVFVGGDLDIDDNDALVTLDLPSLVTVYWDFYCNWNPLLENVNLPNWVPSDFSRIDFSDCKLTAASVEQILGRCVLAGITACTIDLSGGTNAGTASLSPQGQADVATLGGQLTINP
jgi:hypothetical protein